MTPHPLRQLAALLRCYTPRQLVEAGIRKTVVLAVAGGRTRSTSVTEAEAQIIEELHHDLVLSQW